MPKIQERITSSTGLDHRLGAMTLFRRHYHLDVQSWGAKHDPAPVAIGLIRPHRGARSERPHPGRRVRAVTDDCLLGRNQMPDNSVSGPKSALTACSVPRVGSCRIAWVPRPRHLSSRFPMRQTLKLVAQENWHQETQVYRPNLVVSRSFG